MNSRSEDITGLIIKIALGINLAVVQFHCTVFIRFLYNKGNKLKYFFQIRKGRQHCASALATNDK